MTVVTAIADYGDALGNRIVGNARNEAMVRFANANGSLIVGEDVEFTGSIHFDSPGGQVFIGDGCRYDGKIRVGLNSVVRIGSALTVTENCFISAVEGASVTIGDDCMFATLNQIRTDDAHAIYDRATGKRLNPSKSVTIGNHVWLAYEAIVLAGGSIGDGSIVGIRSMVKSVIPRNSIAVGSPARIVREGVAWERAHLSIHAPYSFGDRDPYPE